MTITRKQAMQEGKNKYFTGVPCRNMHVAYRYVANGHCVACSYDRSTSQSEKDKAISLRIKNKSKTSEYHLMWVEKNREKKNAYMRDYNKAKHASGVLRKKYREDPFANLEAKSRSRITKAFQHSGYTKNSSTQQLVGCSWDFLRSHIERQFPKGMTWSNRSDWHIDHIIPIASAKDEQDLIGLFHFTNLRPLWALENRKKNAKVETLL